MVAWFSWCTDGAIYKINTAHYSLPFLHPFQSSAKPQGIVEEDTSTCPLQQFSFAVYQSKSPSFSWCLCLFRQQVSKFCSWQQAAPLCHFSCTNRTTEPELSLLPGCVHTQRALQCRAAHLGKAGVQKQCFHAQTLSCSWDYWWAEEATKESHPFLKIIRLNHWDVFCLQHWGEAVLEEKKDW